MLFIAVNSPNLAHQHWEDKKKTSRRPNNFDCDCCIAEVLAWMFTNRLKINDTKTEFPYAGSQLSKVQLESVTVEDSEISVRNLGAWFDGQREQFAVRPFAIYISSDRSESIYRKMLLKSWFMPLYHLVSCIATTRSLVFKIPTSSVAEDS